LPHARAEHAVRDALMLSAAAAQADLTCWRRRRSWRTRGGKDQVLERLATECALILTDREPRQLHLVGGAAAAWLLRS
jgi:hypothetical protein